MSRRHTTPSRLAERRRPLGYWSALLAFTFAITISTTNTNAQLGQSQRDLSRTFDIRNDKQARDAAAYLQRVHARTAALTDTAVKAQAVATAIADLRTDRAIETALSPELGTLEVVGAKPGSGFLTGPSGDRVGSLRSFLSNHAAAFGLTDEQVHDLVLVANYENSSGNMAWVEFEQRINGLPVFRGHVRGGFTAKGELARTTGQLAAGLDATSLSPLPAVSAADAVSRAAAHVGWDVAVTALAEKTVEAGGRRFTLSGGGMGADATAWQVCFPLAPGVARVAWATQIWGDPDAFLIVLDAEDGTVLFRKNLTDYQTQAVTYSIYNDDSPAPASPSIATPDNHLQAASITRTTHVLIGNEAPYTFNNLGWISDAGDTTAGNNVIAGLDLNPPDGIDSIPSGSSPRVFNFGYNPEVDNPANVAYRAGEVTNMFYWANRFHDLTYQLGFTEAAGNFQQNNFGRGGIGGDPISAQTQDYSGTNNANFTTGPDGGPARMQMYVWTGANPDRSGGLDRDVMLHELTHGLSNRLHANAAGLTSNMSAGMGEGWSDFYARSLAATADENSNAVYTVGGWITNLAVPGYIDNYFYGIRRFPYAPITLLGGPSSRPFNPLTFADADFTDFNISNGAYPRGPFGSAIVDAVHNLGEIWASGLFEVRARLIARHGFALGNQRTLQFVTDGMKLDPASPTFLEARDSILAAATAGGASAAEIGDIWAGFAARGMGVFATIENTGGAAGNNTTRVTESFNAPGDSLPTFSIDDVSVTEGNGGTTTATFTVTLANPTSATPRVSYTTVDGTATSGATFASATPITIPGSGTGPAPASLYPSSIAVSGVPGTIQRVRASFTGLSHTFPDDIDILLVGPTGQKVLLMSDAGGLNDIGNINLMFSDGAPALPDSALLTSGTYAPTNYEVEGALPAPAPAAPYETALSAFNGTNPNGTWSLYVVDDASGDAGSLGGFSLIITTATHDFVGTSGELDFPPGTATRMVNVTINGDTNLESHETFSVVLSNPVSGVIGDGTGLGVIISDEGAPPTSFADHFTTSVNTPLDVPLPGVLANDSSNGGGAMTATLVSGPSSGGLTLNANGSFHYEPATGFTGTVTCTYRASNTYGDGNIATVTITVFPPAAPTSSADSYTTPFNTALAVAAPGVLGNDNSNGGGAMTAAVVTSVTNGVLTLNGDGSFHYQPNAGYVGADSFTYRASNAGGLGTVTAVTINVVHPTTPQPPANLLAYSIVGNLVTLRWTPATIGPAATGFVIEGGLDPGRVLGSLPTGSPYPAFTFSAPTGAFYLRVHQLSGADRSPASNEIRLYVSVPTPPSPPANLLGLVNGTSLNLAWRNTFEGGAPASLLVDVTGPVTGSLPVALTDQLQFNGVPPGSYTIALRAANAAGVSAATNSIVVSVPSACAGPPLPPANFVFYKAGGTVFALWDPPPTGPASSGYVLNVSGPITLSLPLGARSISGVPPPGTYGVSVAATNACGPSAPTAVQTIVVP